jgi:hypothetical protein
MSTKKISKEVAAAIIGGIVGGLFGLGIALIGSWEKFFPPSPSIRLAQGDWIIREKLKSKQDSSETEIEWKYTENVIDNTTLSMKGKKVKIGKSKPTQEERSVTSFYRLEFKDLKAEGKYNESNAKKPDLSGTIKLNFKDNTFASFDGTSYDSNGREESIIRGYRP